MLAAAARKHSDASDRLRMHLDLASVVNDATLQARHLAIASAGPEATLAGTLAAASLGARERGALEDAEELAAYAFRLTPRDDPHYPDRLMALARSHATAGDLHRATELLTERMAELPAGRTRALAHLLLGEGASLAEEEVHLERALTEAGQDPEVVAIALARRATLLAVNRVEAIERAEQCATQALAAAKSVGAEVQRSALAALAWARVLRGRPVDALAIGETASSARTTLYDSSLERPIGVRLAFRGEVEAARCTFERLLALADERGEVRFGLVLQVQLCELDLRSGDVRQASGRLEDFDQWSALEETTSVKSRLSALLAAITGNPTEAARLAAPLLAPPAPTGDFWDRLEAARALGLAALFEHEPSRSAGYLLTVWSHTVNEHVDDPGAFPVAADLVEALVEAEDLVTAREVAEWLRRLSVEQEHPWGLASSKRCSALLALSSCYDEGAAMALGEAADEYGELGLGFDQGRTLLLLGRLQRRHLKRSGARRSLEDAAATFARLGCSGWAEQARAEAVRVSGRRSSGDDQLTPSERRAADLAASGLSNKQIADQLFVSVYTVESHLSHAYAKLGVRSRSQLARHLGDPPHPG
jgi:DNA-binding CsgD family transcriptional regulator